MEKYIKLDDAITTLHKYFPLSFDRQDAEDDLKSIPAADVEKVRHGEWLFINRIGRKEMWMCDQCERCIIAEDHGKRKIDLDRDYPYCHCGAKMDKGAKD